MNNQSLQISCNVLGLHQRYYWHLVVPSNALQLGRRGSLNQAKQLLI